MKVLETGIPGLIEIYPDIIFDNRGHFIEIYNKAIYSEFGITNEFCQENTSRSSYGVIRGLHFQHEPYAQAKLAMAIEGIVYDVAVDIRNGSPTYGQWKGVILDAKKHNQFFIPQGFAHGISILSEFAVFSYKCDNLYHPESEDGISFDDPDLNIDWKIPKDKYILSEKDRNRHRFIDISTTFSY